MREEVFKVADLQTIFESIERDIAELKETLSKIPKNRDYSFPIINSIKKEIEKLEKKKELILNLEVKLPLDVLDKGEKQVEESFILQPISPKEQTPKKIIRRY